MVGNVDYGAQISVSYDGSRGGAKAGVLEGAKDSAVKVDEDPLVFFRADDGNIYPEATDDPTGLHVDFSFNPDLPLDDT